MVIGLAHFLSISTQYFVHDIVEVTFMLQNHLYPYL